MMKQRGYGAFSFGACDADDLFTVGGDKYFHLRSKTASVFRRVFGENDAGTFEDQVIIIQAVHICRTGQNLYGRSVGRNL